MMRVSSEASPMATTIIVLEHFLNLSKFRISLMYDFEDWALLFLEDIIAPSEAWAGILYLAS